MNKKRLVIRIAVILVLIGICAVMMVVGRGHTVYIDSKSFTCEGVTYTPPYKAEIYVDGERVAKLYDGERGMATNIGQKFEMTVVVTETKGGSETTEVYQIKLPYNMDGIIYNLPALHGGVDPNDCLEEFIATVDMTEEDVVTDEFAGLSGDDAAEG